MSEAAVRAAGLKVLATLEAAGYGRIDVAVLQPADVFLDLSGEDIRNRLFLMDDGEGERLCLRPDLTIPTCRHYLEIAGEVGLPARYAYLGPVFRRQSDAARPREFLQAGFECFGEDDAAAADAEAIALAVQAVRGAGAGTPELALGDIGLVHAFLDGLDLGAARGAALKRAFWKPAKFRALLARYGKAGAAVGEPALAEALQAMPEKQARAVIGEVLALAGIAAVGGRSAGEVADRFLARAAEASAAPLTAGVVTLIDRFLGIAGPASAAADSLAAVAKDAGVSLDGALQTYARRLDLARGRGVDVGAARFDADFGRRMEYYTGLVFEVTVAGAAVAGGGRYDRMLAAMGAGREIPAVGCEIRPHLLTGGA